MSVAFTRAPVVLRGIRVLVVDDSAVAREVLSAALRRGGFEVETAQGAQSALQRIMQRRPDVMLLDLQMPGMTGLELLESVMRSMPMPVVVCSSIARPGAKDAIRALELGAVDVIPKPAGGVRAILDDAATGLCPAVAAAATARPHWSHPVPAPAPSAIAPRYGLRWNGEAIVIGASTGGTEALRTIMSQLPREAPPVAIVQHMPGAFTGAFARRLNSLSAVEVREARDGDVLTPGFAVVAPGGRQMELQATSTGLHVRVFDGDPVCGHRPSVDVLFKSATRAVGHRAVGVLLTGIGQDGSQGLLQLKESGAHTISQGEESCVVFGMPRAAVEIGASCEVADLDNIPAAIMTAVQRRALARSTTLTRGLIQ